MLHVDPANLADTAAETPVPARALIEAQLAALTRLTQIGMDIAEAAGRQADQAPQEAGLTYARVARAVRMTIALQSRLLKDRADFDRADYQAQAARKSRRRLRLRQLVAQAAWDGLDARRAGEDPELGWTRSEAATENEVERLTDSVCERLTDAEDSGFWSMSFEQVVASVIKDLGVTPDWTDRLMAVVARPSAPARAAPDHPPPPRPFPPPDEDGAGPARLRTWEDDDP